MKFTNFKEDLSEICSQEELEQFEAMVSAFQKNPNGVLDGINARQFVEFYVKSYLCAKKYSKKCMAYKVNNIDGKQTLEEEVRENYSELEKKMKKAFTTRRMIEQFASRHKIGRYVYGGKSVLETATLIAQTAELHGEDKKGKDQIEFYLDYIDKADKALGLYEENLGDE